MNYRLNTDERDELVEVLRAVLSIPTEDPPGREIEMARYLQQTLQQWGFAVEFDEFAPQRVNLISRIGNQQKPALVFSAHMDTMPAGKGHWQHAPFAAEMDHQRIYGRGAADMKSGLAAMMMAAKKVAAECSTTNLNGQLILAFSAGESSSCLGAKRFIETGALRNADAILVSEPSSLNVLIAENGALWLKISATGTPGHASGAAGSMGAGDNAIIKIVDAINALRDYQFDIKPHPLLGAPTLRVGTISGGSAINLTPDYAEAGIDIRYVPGMSSSNIITALQKLTGDSIQFEILDDKPPIEADPDHPFVSLCVDACKANLSDVAAPGGVSYFSDSNVLCPALGVPRVIIGPGELGMSGQRDEYVEIDKLVLASEIYSKIALDFFNQTNVARSFSAQ